MILGVDIGTHWARAAYLDAAGEAHLVRLPDGSTALPTVARQSFLGLEVGHVAAQQLAGNAEVTLRGCTRLLGRPGDLPPRVVDRLPYAVRVEGGEAVCNLLYAEVSVAAVLQQRVVNHMVSLLKIAAGMAPDQAFLGRVAH